MDKTPHRTPDSSVNRGWAAWILSAGALALCFVACGPVHFVNLDKRFELYYPIYQETTSSLGWEEIEVMIEDVPDRQHVAIASQELPFPLERVWKTIEAELNAYPSEIVRADRRDGTVRIGLHRSLSVPLLGYEVFQQSWMKVVESGYGTVVVHLAVLRYEVERPDQAAGSVGGSTQDTLQGLARRLSGEDDSAESRGDAAPKPADESGSDAPSVRAARPISQSRAFRHALVSLELLGQEIDPELSGQELAATVREKRRSHRLRTTAPPGLELAVEFSDADSPLANGLLDPGEPAELLVDVTNHGRGTAFDVKLVISARSDSLAVPGEVLVGNLDAGGSSRVAVDLEPALDLPPGEAVLTVAAIEERGYRATPLEIELGVAPLLAPSLAIGGVSIDDRSLTGGDGDGMLGSGETVELTAILHNTGLGPAVGVGLELAAEPDLGFRALQEVGSVPAGRSVEVRLPLTLPRVIDIASLRLHLVATDGRGEPVGAAYWSGELPVTARFPLIELEHRLFDGDSSDSAGDRDGVAETAERIELELRATNSGRLAARGVRVALSSPAGAIDVRPARFDLGDLPAGAEAAPRRIAFDVPRGLELDGLLVLYAEVEQRDFAPGVRTLEIPFALRKPDLRLGTTAVAPLVHGKAESRSLSLANVGTLAAEGVRVTVAPGSEGLEVLGPAGETVPSRSIEAGSLGPLGGVADIPVTLFAKGDVPAGGSSLEVTISQQYFEPVTVRLAVPIQEETPRLVEVARRGSEAGADSTALGEERDLTPPGLWVLEPGAGGAGGVAAVDSAEIEVKGMVQDASGVYRVRIQGQPVEVESNGEFSAWVKLGFGRNQVEIEALDTRGNRASRVFVVDRSSAAGGARRDRALIFATDRYEHWPSLANPVQDGRALNAILESLYGFESEVVTNPTKVQVLRTLRRYAQMSPGPDDQLLVFFGGHGHFDESFREGYVVTRESLRVDEIGQSFISYSQLSTILDSLPFPHVLVVLDVCFGGTFDQRIREAGYRGESLYADLPAADFIRRTLARTTRKYLASGGKEYVPDGKPGRHSPFMDRFLQALSSGGGRDRILTMAEVVSFLEKLQPEPRAGGFGDDELGSDFLFVNDPP